MMSATDPVATIAVLAEVGAPRQLRTLIEGESLVNDGTAYVLFFLLRVRYLSRDNCAPDFHPGSVRD